MAEPSPNKPASPAAVAPESSAPAPSLDQGTYEVLRSRLAAHGTELRSRLDQLNRARQEVFGALTTTLLATERIITANNCLPRDMVALGGNRFLFGYNVHLGLRSEIQLEDVFALYDHQDHRFSALSLETLADSQFLTDFRSLYRYYRHTVFARFSRQGPHLFMVFRVGKGVPDIKTFKWVCEDGRLAYLGNRFDHEYRYPPTHEFEWKRTHRELHRGGLHPHIAIEDRVFVECIGGDLTVKVEDNTASGEGIYAEPVEQKDQTLDDAEIYYAAIGNLVLLKIRPYQEPTYRYLVFNEKLKEVRRIDALAEACVLLPDTQGIIFPRGYYLQSGECKLFETALTDMVFSHRLVSPNGEDVLFVFYNRLSGHYVLLSYNLIARTVETPIICGGFSLFENGEMAVFRVEDQPQKHHAIQIWQTPFVGPAWQLDVRTDSYLHKIGNADLVRCMAECQEVLTLLGKDDTYGGLYLDLVRRSTDILDSYFWLDRPDTFDLREPLTGIHAAAASALAEFDKVVRLRRAAAETVTGASQKSQQLLRAIAQSRFETITPFVQRLAELRALRGELISFREIRYVNRAELDRLEQEVANETARLSQRAIASLQEPRALDPIRERVETLRGGLPSVGKVADANELEKQLQAAAAELDLLTETVTNLKIQDATEATRVVEDISAIYAVVNQLRAGLKQRRRDLRSAEAAGEFASQARLLDQALASYLDLAGTTQKCDEFLNRILVQVEELEARFADFEEYVVTLAEKRTALTAAFDARKVELLEARNRRANALLEAATRILKAIAHRAGQFTELAALNGYFATDAMVEKVRDLGRQLLDLGDTVKADDLQTRLKTQHEEAVRQLKDRQDLFAGGADVIQLGRHRFLVNTQELALTMLPRGERFCLHVTGTSFFEPVEDPELEATRAVWSLETATETATIYRGEYLAYRLLSDGVTGGARLLPNPSASGGERPRPGQTTSVRGEAREDARPTEANGAPTVTQLAQVRAFMAEHPGDGYVKGVHDLDGEKVLAALLGLRAALGPLGHQPKARACAAVYWDLLPDDDAKRLLAARFAGYGALKRRFPMLEGDEPQLAELRTRLAEFCRSTGLFEHAWVGEAAECLLERLSEASQAVVSAAAVELAAAFERQLKTPGSGDGFQAARSAVERDPVVLFALLRDAVAGFAGTRGDASMAACADEAAWLLMRSTDRPRPQPDPPTAVTVEGLVGHHPRITAGKLSLDYHEFTRRLRRHVDRVVPLFEQCHAAKRRLLAGAAQRLHLDAFQPRVLTSFVRNRLIDRVYLPLIGDNLAKQIGAAGEAKRTDRMGMLLLISPPGYGKTTLMEYLASRLGIVFVKINGPAIGHRVTSLDPAEAPNAAAREELNKLNLAFALGDNLMVCLDDIQHLNPEFLQKFIPLCDAQRRIEGVYRGQARTFDLRGKKAVVVMAGNPYTESGERFRIPDMLANRADTYNLGDVLGGHETEFRLSYLENAAGSNPILAPIVGRQPKDLYALIQWAETGSREGADFDGAYAAEELADAVGVMQKLLRIRDVVLRVNAEYIRSAGIAEAFRTEPAFNLQGSYRNMNRLAEQVSPVMNDAELEALLQSHYRNEAQTLTKGAEANLLKFRELTGVLSAEEAQRWEEIKKTFRRNLLVRAGDETDPAAQVVRQLAAFYDGLEGIKDVLASGLIEVRSSTRPPSPPPPTPPPPPPVTLIVAPMVAAPAAVGPPASSTPESVPPPERALSVSDGIREVRITADTLRKIWEVIEQQTPPAPDSPPEGGTTVRMPEA